MTIDQLAYITLDLCSNDDTNVPFIGDNDMCYKNIGTGMFKDYSLLGTFSLPPPNKITLAPIHMISFDNNGSLRSYDPRVMPHPLEVDSYGSQTSLSAIEISYEVI